MRGDADASVDEVPEWLRGALSPREREVLQLVSRGKSNADVARELGVSCETVKSHVRHILEKLGAHTRAQAVAVAVRAGLIA